MLPPPLIFGHLSNWFFIFYILGISAFVIALLSYIFFHPVFRLSLDFIGVAILFYAIHIFLRPLWIILDNHYNGTFTLYDHTWTQCYQHVDPSDRWYFCTLLISVYLCILAKRRNPESSNLLYGADLILMCICLCLPIVRIGCMLSGHGCYGTPTCLPWGCVFNYGMPSGGPVHPIPVYDGLMNLSVFIFLNIKRWYLRFPGWSALTVLTAASIHNIITGPLRSKPPIVFAGITMTQILYALVLCFCVVLYFRLRERDKAMMKI